MNTVKLVAKTSLDVLWSLFELAMIAAFVYMVIFSTIGVMAAKTSNRQIVVSKCAFADPAEKAIYCGL